MRRNTIFGFVIVLVFMMDIMGIHSVRESAPAFGLLGLGWILDSLADIIKLLSIEEDDEENS